MSTSGNPGIPRAIYRHSCPNCGGPNTEERLKEGLPCPHCLPHIRIGEPKRLGTLEIYDMLKSQGTLKQYEHIASLERKSTDLIKFFERAVGSPPWGAQKTWARRLIRGDSFSIVAPTGVGKTTFGLVAALYFACKYGEKSYIVLPTTTLVMQAEKKALSMMAMLNCNTDMVAIHSRMPRKLRDEQLRRIESGDFTVLITTAAFARTKVDIVSKYRYRLVFVDDVDAVLKSAKSVNVILRIAGFTEDEMEAGMQVLRLQVRRAILLNRLSRLREQPGMQEQVERVRKELDEVEAELEKLRKLIEKARSKAASLIVSTATGRPRGARVRLFRSLLGFEAGGRTAWGLRRVYDLYTYPEDGEVYRKVAEIVSSPLFRRGGLVYVPIDHGVEGAEKLAELLRSVGVKAAAFHSKSRPGLLEAFASGDLEVLVGVANYYGVLVRGLDLPETVRYAVFAGVPRHKFSADIDEPHPARLIRLLALLVEAPMEDVAGPAREHMVRLRNLLRRLSPAALHVIAERVAQGDVDRPGTPTRIVWEAYNFLLKAMEDPEVWSYLSSRKDVAVIEEHGKRYVLIADAPTYIQASGRTSRLYAGGVTRGISVVVVDNEAVFNGLMRRTRLFIEAEWKRLEEVDVESLIREVDEDREKVRRLRRGEARLGDLVRTALLIVESPNKARTIASFFGQPSIRLLPSGSRVYEVAMGKLILLIIASGGHVYDLAPKASKKDLSVGGIEDSLDLFAVAVSESGEGRKYTPVYTSIKRCLDCGYQFTADLDRCPVCGSKRIRNSLETVEDIRRVAWEVDTVLIGTDPDMEGEKIGWDIANLIGPYSRSIKRVEFHEITKKAILDAIENPREFDLKLVDAQVVRRVDDRWIGYTLSPLLWCHFWPYYYCPELEMLGIPRGRFLRAEQERCRSRRYFYNLSAGRVQTPVLGWVVNRTAEAKEKVFSVSLLFKDGSRVTVRQEDITGPLTELSELYKSGTKAGGRSRQARLVRELEVRTKVLDRREDVLPPPPPYSTDLMLADASRYLGLGAPETMRLAQNLFEWGFITYHRTDSTRVSEKGMEVAREWLREQFEDLYKELYRPRSWGEGGAHEAIRLTRPIDAETLWNMINEGIIEVPGVVTRNHIRLYDLIFRRFMASQMREAIVERSRYEIEIPLHGLKFEVEGITRIGREGDPASKGFTLVWPYIRLLPRLEDGYLLVDVLISKVSKVPPYTHGELVQEMKRRGIGRPSTYAKIIDTLIRRRYVTRPGNRALSDYLVSTIRGEKVYEYFTEGLSRPESLEYFKALGKEAIQVIERVPRLVSEEETKNLETRMSEIESGEANRDLVLNKIYTELKGLALPISIIVASPEKAASEEFKECIRNSIAARTAKEGVRRWVKEH